MAHLPTQYFLPRPVTLVRLGPRWSRLPSRRPSRASASTRPRLPASLIYDPATTSTGLARLRTPRLPTRTRRHYCLTYDVCSNSVADVTRVFLAITRNALGSPPASFFRRTIFRSTRSNVPASKGPVPVTTSRVRTRTRLFKLFQ